MLKQGQVYETIADVHHKISEHDNPHAIESDNTSPEVKKIPPVGHISRAKEETRNVAAIPAVGTGYTLSIQKDDPGYVMATIRQKREHSERNYEVPALPVEIPGYPNLGSEKIKDRNTKEVDTYQKSVKHESHDHKVTENLSDYQELDQCRREVNDSNIYQKLLKT